MRESVLMGEIVDLLGCEPRVLANLCGLLAVS